MTRDFGIAGYKVRTMLEYAPEDFDFCYFWRNTGIVSISGQFGPFYYFFGVTKAPK